MRLKLGGQLDYVALQHILFRGYRAMSLDIISLLCCIAPSVLIGSSLNLQIRVVVVEGGGGGGGGVCGLGGEHGYIELCSPD